MHSGVAIPLLRRAQFSFSMARRGARHSFASIQTALVALQRNVLLCKMVPTAWGFAFGDCLTQVRPQRLEVLCHRRNVACRPHGALPEPSILMNQQPNT